MQKPRPDDGQIWGQENESSFQFNTNLPQLKQWSLFCARYAVPGFPCGRRLLGGFTGRAWGGTSG